MTPSPSPTPVDVFVHSGPAEWWQILAALGPLAVLLGAGIAGYIGWRTLRQKTEADNRMLLQKAEADNRAEWWKRTQWALDAVYSDNKKRGTVGLKVLKVLGESGLAGPGELAVLEAAWEKPLDAAERTLRSTVTGQPAASGGASAAPPPGVDGEPGPRDNGENDQPGTIEGGTR